MDMWGGPQKLNTYPGNNNAYKALIAAKYAGVELDVPAFNFGVTNRTPEYLAKFHVTMVPTFEGRNGELIFESNAIARFVASQTADGAKLLGNTPLEQALVASMLDLIISEVTPANQGWVYPIQGWRAYDAAVLEHSKKAIQKVFGTFDRILADKTYLVGEAVTLADIVFVCATLNLYKLVRAARSPFRWHTHAHTHTQGKTQRWPLSPRAVGGHFLLSSNACACQSELAAV
jgi:elongation factor 1-gamma